MMRFSSLLITLAICVAAQDAMAKPGADCDVAIQPSSNLVRMFYDPFERDLAPSFITLTITNKADDKCQLALSIDSRGPRAERRLVNGSSSLGYEVSREGRLLENETGAPQVQLPLQSGKSGETQVELRFRIRDGDFVPAGEYTDEMVVRLYQIGAGPPRQISPETVLRVSALVPARAQLNVAGSNTRVFGANPAGGIDFGELKNGAEREAFIQVRATSPVILRLSSANQGQLRHANFGESTAGVPYALSVDGNSVALGSGPVQLFRDPSSAFRPESYRALFTIVDATGKPAGLYRDVLTISVEPR